MVRKKGFPLFGLLILFFSQQIFLSAETVTSAEVYLNTVVVVTEEGASSKPLSETNLAGNTGGLKIGLDSAKTDAVKASISVSLNNTGTLILEKAYLKTRFPWIVKDTSLRFTAGKAPLSWGKGFLFNAGDPVFGAIPSIANLSASEYRTATTWLTAAYIPLGAFSFAELVYLPPVAETTAPIASDEKNRAGARLFITPGAELLQSVEAGYLYKEGSVQSSYIGFDGSLFFDYYGAASLTIAGDTANLFTEAEYALSFGLFRMFTFIPDIPLSLRAEALIYPKDNCQVWYPSLQAKITDSVQLTMQALFASGEMKSIRETTAKTMMLQFPFSPGAGLGGLTCTWSPLKGFTLSGTLFKRFEKGDIWEKDYILQASTSYVF